MPIYGHVSIRHVVFNVLPTVETFTLNVFHRHAFHHLFGCLQVEVPCPKGIEIGNEGER